MGTFLLAGVKESGDAQRLYLATLSLDVEVSSHPGHRFLANPTEVVRNPCANNIWERELNRKLFVVRRDGKFSGSPREGFPKPFRLIASEGREPGGEARSR